MELSKSKKINIIAPTTPNLSGLKTIRALANNWKEIINTALNLGAGNRNLLNTLTALSKDKENSIADTQKNDVTINFPTKTTHSDLNIDSIIQASTNHKLNIKISLLSAPSLGNQ
ncbi:hypothetical protein P4052_31755 [Pseudomonas aeruginosa]|nr:hypothetical protein [Pseudomonas aeruginosa]